MRMRHTVICGVSGSTIFFHIISQRARRPKKKDTKLHFDFSTNLSETSHSKKNSAIYDQKCILVFMYSTRYSCQVSMKLQFSLQIFENTQVSNFMKIRSAGAELFHADGQTGGNRHTTKTTGAFRNFVNAP